MCEDCDNSNDKYCDDCLKIRLQEILREQEPNITDFTIEMWVRFLIFNRWALLNFLEKYDK